MTKKAFTLIELLITMSIIILMAVVAIPSFGKHQAFIDLQNKSDEIKAGLEEMQLKAMNPEQGVEYYGSKVDETKIEFNRDGVVYKTINLATDQTITGIKECGGSDCPLLFCDKGKSFCYEQINSPSVVYKGEYFSIENTNTNKKATFTISENPFRVTVTTTP